MSEQVKILHATSGSALPQEKMPSTSTANEYVKIRDPKTFDLSDIFILHASRSWDAASTIDFVEKMMNQEVITRFSKFPEVTLITRQNKPDHIKFNIYTSNLQYDRKLSRLLIRKEMEVMGLFPGIIFDFHHRTFNPEFQSEPEKYHDEEEIYIHDRPIHPYRTGRT